MRKSMMTAALLLASTALSVQAAEGEDTYNAYCMACHGTGIGPMVHDQSLWQPRLDAKGGIDGLLASAKQGLNQMPAKGTCMDCSDEQLRAAIQFMVSPQ